MASSYSFICARTRGSTISTPPRCGGGAGKLLFFLDLEAPLEEALDRPEDLEDVFCTFAMARMLAEALPHVNASGRLATIGPGAVFDSLNRPGAILENNLLENA